MDRDEKVVVGIDFIPGDVREVMERLVRSGFGVWLVGGAVRDYLRGDAPKDWDLATDATPQEVTSIFKRVVPVGLRHGTIQVHTKERDIEVTSCPERGQAGIFRDLARRDFTVNAMALSYPEGELLDLYNGREDLEGRVLRGVADPRARFREDPLRTIRAFRFVSSYGFSVDPGTLSAAGEEAGGLEGVASERIREEMLRLIGGENVVRAMKLMRDGRVLPVVLPELMDGCGMRQGDHYRLDVFEHTIHAVQNSAPRTLVRMAALFHRLGKPVAEREGGTTTMASMRVAEAVLQRWLAPPRRIRDVVLLLENQVPPGAGKWSDAHVRHFISRIGPNHLEDLLDLGRAERSCWVEPEAALDEIEVLHGRIRAELDRKSPLFPKDLALNGADIMRALGIGQSPLVGQILRELHRLVLDDPNLNDPQILRSFVLKAYHGTGSGGNASN